MYLSFKYILLGLLLTREADKIKVGVLLPLSGPIRSYGEHCLKGIKLASLNYPEIDLIVKDNKGLPTNTVIEARNLAHKGVIGILGPLISPNALVAGIEISQYGIPIILPTATNTAITRASMYLFRTCFTDSAQGSKLAKFLYKMNKKEVQIIADTTNIYSASLALHFKRELESLGGKTKIIEWDGKFDITTIVEKLENMPTFLPLYYEEAIKIIMTARAKGLDVKFIGADGWDSPELFEALKEDTSTFYFSTHYFVDEGTKFVKLYEERYKSKPNTFSALGYDAATILFNTIKNTKTKTTKEILDSLMNITNFVGVTGVHKYNGRRDPDKQVFIVKLKLGKLTLIE